MASSMPCAGSTSNPLTSGSTVATSSTHSSMETHAGVRQGDELSALIPADRRNRVVDGQAIHVPPTGPVHFVAGWSGCTLLSPSRKRLEKLFDRWPDPLRVAEDPTEDLLTKLEDPLTRGLGEFGEDTSVANGSSIAVLFESGGASLLLTGDAYPRTSKSRSANCLHSGTSRSSASTCSSSPTTERQNMTDGLLALIDPGAVLVCTDGSKFHHPDEDTLEKVRAHYPKCRSISRTTPISSASAPLPSALTSRRSRRCRTQSPGQ